MSRPRPSGRSYGRLTRHERNAIERMLDRNRSAREIAAELGRSPSTVTREVAAHRYVTAPRSRYGEPAPEDLSGACPRLAAWPRCCNGLATLMWTVPGGAQETGGPYMRDPRHPRHFTDEFKRQIVDLYNAGKPKREIMDEYDLGKSTVERWIKSINATGSPRAACNRTPEQNRILELERENRRLRMEVDVLNSNPTTWKMAQMNLAIRGIEADLGKFNADTFFNDCHPQLKADFIMANPPFNLSGWGADKLVDDVRWQYGTPPAGNANFAWLQHMIWHLAPNGRIGMVLANGSLSSQSGGEGEIRKNIINADLVDCIVAMPTQLFYTTQIPVSLWFLAKNKKQKGKTLFIDARKLGTMVTRKLRELTDEDIKKIADTYNAFVEGTLEDEKGFCAVVTTQDIAKQDYILTPGRYVGIEEQEDDDEPFEEKMGRLTSELSELFTKSHELEAQIKERLGAIGYGL